MAIIPDEEFTIPMMIRRIRIADINLEADVHLTHYTVAVVAAKMRYASHSIQFNH